MASVTCKVVVQLFTLSQYFTSALRPLGTQPLRKPTTHCELPQHANVLWRHPLCCVEVLRDVLKVVQDGRARKEGKAAVEDSQLGVLMTKGVCRSNGTAR